MRRIIAGLVIAILALTLVGCGGGKKAEPTAAPAAAPAAAAPAAAPAPAGDAAVIADRSGNVSATFAPFPVGEFVPAQLKQKIDAKQPTVILFHDGSYTSKESRKIIDSVRNENRGMTDLSTFDLSRFVTTGTDGKISVDPALIQDPTASQAVQLARALGVTSVPFVVVTDNQGYVIWKYRGLLDKAFFEREVQRATR